MFTDETLPVFVYGTLRTGQGNYRRLLAGNTVAEQRATLSGAVISGRGVPFVGLSDNPADIVVGDLMTLDPARYSEIMRDLDRLEGYRGPGSNNMYDREIVTVTIATTGEQVRAYVYLCERFLDRTCTIPGGDFLSLVDA